MHVRELGLDPAKAGFYKTCFMKGTAQNGHRVIAEDVRGTEYNSSCGYTTLQEDSLRTFRCSGTTLCRTWTDKLCGEVL
jgi:hypothetical protein